jgi:hypothetical protein
LSGSWLGSTGHDLAPQLAGHLGRIHRIMGGGVLREGGFSHAVQDDPQGKVSLRKGIAHAISFQKRNDRSWSCPDARSCQGRIDLAHGGVAGHDLSGKPRFGFQGLPHIGVKTAFGHIADDADELVGVSLAKNAAFPLFDVGGTPRASR